MSAGKGRKRRVPKRAALPDQSASARGTEVSPSRRPPRLLQLRNRQKRQTIDLPLLKSILAVALVEELGVTRHEVCVHLVGAGEMTSVNETFLRHEGSTDVITFNHQEPVNAAALHGELFVCVDEAVELAGRFRSTWQEEIVRYSVHGFLHLQGHDDLAPDARRRMKRIENRVLRSLRNRFAVDRIGRRIRRAQ